MQSDKLAIHCAADHLRKGAGERPRQGSVADYGDVFALDIGPKASVRYSTNAQAIPRNKAQAHWRVHKDRRVSILNEQITIAGPVVSHGSFKVNGKCPVGFRVA